MKHYFNEGKEYLKKDDKFDYQYRTPKQYEDSAKIVLGAFVICGVILLTAVVQHLVFVLFN